MLLVVVNRFGLCVAQADRAPPQRALLAYKMEIVAVLVKGNDVVKNVCLQ